MSPAASRPVLRTSTFSAPGPAVAHLKLEQPMHLILWRAVGAENLWQLVSICVAQEAGAAWRDGRGRGADAPALGMRVGNDSPPDPIF